MIASCGAAGAQSADTTWPGIDLRLSGDTPFQAGSPANAIGLSAGAYERRVYDREARKPRLDIQVDFDDQLSVLLPAKQFARPLKKEFMLIVEFGF